MHDAGRVRRKPIERDGRGLAEDTEEKEPQRIEVDAAFRRAKAQEQHREREREEREPAHLGMHQRIQAVVLGHQNFSRPDSMSRHITQSPMKL